MSPKKLRENLEAVHAKSFTVNVSDGRHFNVPHTDYLMLTADAEQVILLEHGKTLRIIDAGHITSIDFEPAKKSKSTDR
jgi:hypothetical protein